MSTPAPEAGPKSAAKSPFWQFSVKFYAAPDVAPACIELQDQAGVDVNLLFFLLWNAGEKRTFNASQVAELDLKIGVWRDLVVIPLRQVRRSLKSPAPVVPAAAAEEFRTRIKAAELEAERLEQEALYDLARSAPLGQSAASRETAAHASVMAYQTTLRPFPPAARESLLAAFAKFKMPATDSAE